jgi:hypothetical protein
MPFRALDAPGAIVALLFGMAAMAHKAPWRAPADAGRGLDQRDDHEHDTARNQCG